MQQQKVEDQVERRPVFVDFSIRQNDQVHGFKAAGHRLLQSLRIKRRNDRVGHDQRSRGAGNFLPGRGCIEQAAADQDRVTAFAELYIDLLRC